MVNMLMFEPPLNDLIMLFKNYNLITFHPCLKYNMDSQLSTG